MGILSGVLTVAFFVLCLLLIVIILLQSDKSAGMGILGGSSQTTFGSSTADVITKITTIFVALFMSGSLGLSVLESYRGRAYDPALGESAPARVEQQPGTTAQDSSKEQGVQADKKAPETERNVMKKEMNTTK